MTKETIISILKNISDSYQTNLDDTVTMVHINDTRKCFFVRVIVGTIYCGTIYCDCIRIDDGSELVQFINDGNIISIFNYLAIKEINLL